MPRRPAQRPARSSTSSPPSLSWCATSRSDLAH